MEGQHQLSDAEYQQMQGDHGDDGVTIEMLLTHAIQSFFTKAMENPVQRMLLVMTLRREIGRLGHGEVDGFMDLVKKTFNNEGIFGFFRGLGTDFALTLPGFVNEVIANYYTSQLMNRIFYSLTPESLTPLKEIMINMFSSSLVSLFSIPATGFRETVVTHLQADGKLTNGQKKYRYNGMFDCIKRLYRGGGVRSFYQGCYLGTLNLFMYRTTYYGSFSIIASNMSDPALEVLQLPIAFALTALCGLITQPIEVVRRRMMLAAPSAGRKSEDGTEEGAIVDKAYASPIACVRTILKEGGYPALWEGLGSRLGFSLALLGVRAIGMAL